MYSLDINFLKDRPAYQKNSDKKARAPVQVGNLTPVYAGVGIGLFFPVLVACGWWYVQWQSSQLAEVVATQEQKIQDLDVKIKDINKIQQESAAIKGETQALVTVFDQIRPWSAMLEDLRDRIPKTVQIETIRQIAPTIPTQANPSPNLSGGLEITGFAPSPNDVNDFLLSLGQSKFLKSSESRIALAELVNAPLPPNIPQNAAAIKPPQVVKYTILSSVSDTPASQLIRELEQKGTVGLVARIRSIQQAGVISK